MKELKKIGKSTLIYLIGNIGTKMISFLLLPIYTQYISPKDYGIYDVNCTYAMLISSVLFLDLWAGIMRYMFDYKEEKHKYKVIYSGMVIFLVSTIIYSLIFAIIGSNNLLEYIWLVYAYGLCLCIQNLYSYIARGLGYNFTFAISGIISTLINASINIVLIIFLKYDYKALYIAFIIGIIIQCIVIEKKVKVIKKFKTYNIDTKITKEIFKFSIPLCINSVCYWLLTGYNKIVITNQLDATQNGYYAIASKFAVMLNLVASCFSMAWQEFAFSKSDENAGEFYSEACNIYFKLLYCGAICLIPLIYIVFPIFIGDAYIDAKNIVPIYLLATIWSIFSSFLGSIISAYKKTNVIFVSTLSACIVNIFVIYMLIERIGVQAACVSLLLGYIVNCIIRIIILQRLIRLTFNYKLLITSTCILSIYVYIYVKGSLGINLIMLVAAIVYTVISFKSYIYKLIRKN